MNSTIRNVLAATIMCAALFANQCLAQSSIDLYGQVDVWAGSLKFSGNQSAMVQQGGGMSTSYWGMKGTEDLGGGYQTIFCLESFFLPQSGTSGRFQGDSYFSRNAYVGIKAPWGTVTAGRLTTELYIATVAFNPFHDSYVFSPIVNQVYLGLSTFPVYTTDQGAVGDSGWDNAVEYSTPQFNGLTAGVMFGMGTTAGSNGQHKDSAQLLYDYGPFSATLVYQYVNFNSLANDMNSVEPGLTSQQLGQFGVSYDLKFAKLYGQYMFSYNRDAAGNFKIDTGQLGASIAAGVGQVLASYAYSKDQGGLDLTLRTWALGYDYPLSKRTDIYVAYLSDRYSGPQSAGNTLGAGLRHTF